MHPESSKNAIFGHIVVLETSRPLRPWTRYEDQIFTAMPDDVSVRFASGTAPLSGCDVVHATGSPDGLLGITRPVPAHERLTKVRELVALLEENGTALVRTLVGTRHPADDDAGAEAARLLDDATTTYVVVDDQTPTPDPARTVLIPYADHGPRFLGYPVRQQVDGRVLAVSTGRFGPTASSLLKTSFVTRTPGLSARVAGELDETTAALLARATERDPQAVSARVELLSDAALVEEITAAELVLAPAAQTLDDIHLLMMALSLGRPVLVPTDPTTTALATEVGDGWVLTHEGPVTAQVLDIALGATRTTRRATRPDLSARAWEATAHRYAAVFRDAARTRTHHVATLPPVR